MIEQGPADTLLLPLGAGGEGELSLQIIFGGDEHRRGDDHARRLVYGEKADRMRIVVADHLFQPLMADLPKTGQEAVTEVFGGEAAEEGGEILLVAGPRRAGMKTDPALCRQ